MGYYAYTANIVVHKNDGSSESYTISRSGTRNVPQGTGFFVEVPFNATETYARTGYDFTHYLIGSSKYYPGGVVTFYFSGSGTQTSHAYCQWTLKKFTVAFNANGGTGAPESQVKTYGTAVTLSDTVPTRTNYIFTGWSTSSTGAVEYQPGDEYTAEADATLYAIWRPAAGLLTSVTDTNIGSAGTAVWSKIKETHTYKLVLSCSGASDVVVDNIAAGTSSVGFTIPSSWLSAVPNSTTATATATLYSYNDGELVGSTSMSFAVNVPASVVPVISSFTAVPHSANAVVDGWGVAAQGYSYLALSATANPGTGATIANVTFYGHGISQSSLALSGNTTTLTSTGSQPYTVTVTDSRGRSATQTVNVTVYEYANPYISSLQAVRCMSDGTQSDTEGNYLKVLPMYAYSSVNGHNALSVKKTEYKEHSSTTWLVGIQSTASGAWSAVFGPADVSKAFDVRLTVTDSIGNTYSLETVVLSVIGALALGLKNDRARFGGPARRPGLEVDWDALFDGDVEVLGDLTGGGVVKTISGNGPDSAGDVVVDPASIGAFPVAGSDGFLFRSNGAAGQKELMKTLFHREAANGWSSGSVTVDGLSDYSLFLVRICSSSNTIYGPYLLGALGSNRADGQPTTFTASVFNGSGTTAVTLSLQASVSGDTLTMTRCAYINMRNWDISSGQKVIDIIGVI